MNYNNNFIIFENFKYFNFYKLRKYLNNYNLIQIQPSLNNNNCITYKQINNICKNILYLNNTFINLIFNI